MPGLMRSWRVSASPITRLGWERLHCRRAATPARTWSDSGGGWRHGDTRPTLEEAQKNLAAMGFAPTSEDLTDLVAEGRGEREKAAGQAASSGRPNDQINLTDEESRIMPVAGGGFEQCYNAQAAVAAGSLRVVASAVSQAPNDKQQLEPMVDKIEALPEELGKPECLLADTGYFSAANVAACEKAGIEPLIAMGR